MFQKNKMVQKRNCIFYLKFDLIFYVYSVSKNVMKLSAQRNF